MLERVILFGNLRTRGDELDEPRRVVLIPRREYFVRKPDNELTEKKADSENATKSKSGR